MKFRKVLSTGSKAQKPSIYGIYLRQKKLKKRFLFSVFTSFAFLLLVSYFEFVPSVQFLQIPPDFPPFFNFPHQSPLTSSLTPATNNQTHHPKIPYFPPKFHVRSIPSSYLPRKGVVNLHEWLGLNSFSLESFRTISDFPFRPHLSSFCFSFECIQDFKSGFYKGRKISGYLNPPQSGVYQFALTCDDFCEWFLSKNLTSIKNLVLLGRVSLDQNSDPWRNVSLPPKLPPYSSHYSPEILLSKNTLYYFEATHLQMIDEQHISFYWKRPDSPQWELIPMHHFHSYEPVFARYTLYGSYYVPPLKDGFPLKNTPNFPRNVKRIPIDLWSWYLTAQNSTFDYQTFWEPFAQKPWKLPRLELNSTLFPVCEYSPSYLISHPLSRYEGWLSVFTTMVYPKDDTLLGRFDVRNYNEERNPNLREDLARRVLDRVVSTLNFRTFSYFSSCKFSLVDIFRVSAKRDERKKAIRFLVDISLKLSDRKCLGGSSLSTIFRHVKYYYMPHENRISSLCEPRHISPLLQSTVHFVVPIKNQSRWFQLLLKNMEKIYAETGDEKMSLIIVDFDSQEFNPLPLLEKFRFPHYKYIHATGPFQRALGVQRGLDAVSNPQDIIFACDLNLIIPSSIVDEIRKNTIMDRQAFAPIVARLDPEVYPHYNSPMKTLAGYWETEGFGLFAATKRDWDVAGGMNTKAYNFTWGGEDIDLVDRFLSQRGREIERVRLANFFHYFHTKEGIWGDDA